MSVTFLRKARVALTPRSSLLHTRLENGAIVSGYNRAGYGGRGIYVYRDALEPELAGLRKFLKPGLVFVDIGANVGVYTLKAAKEIGDNGLVIAVEPFLESAHRLFMNVRANGFRNVRVRNVCVGRTTGEATFYLNSGKPNSFGLLQRGEADSLSILSVSLDDLCRWEKIERLDYLKIDAEGAESMILEGGAETIHRFRPVIQVEIFIAGSQAPDGYCCYTANQGNNNNVYIPKENGAALRVVKELGWIAG